jgi:predicted HAD superfamily hydrolase
MYYSFDIFDTCLFRACYSPDNIFKLLARKVLGGQADENKIKDFLLVRKNGESTARANIKGEVTINEIYNYCDFTGLTSISKESIILREYETEKEQLTPNLVVLDYINELHDKGKSVCFVSDMYLSSDFLKEVLKETGFFRSGDFLLVSCEYKKTKRNGKLFGELKKITTNAPLSIKHYGDSLHSDFNMAIKNCIIPVRVRKRYSKYQQFLLANCYLSGEYAKLSAHLSYVVSNNKVDNPHYCFAADFIAPIMVSHVYKILIDAHNRGIKDLFFLARDGFLLYNIAKELGSLFPELSFYYIYASRKALYFPSLHKIDIDNIKDLFAKNEEISFKKILDRLHFVPSFISTLDKDLLDIRGNGALSMFMTNEELVQTAAANLLKEKQLVFDYFKQEGLARHTKDAAIVDLRGTRKCQLAINSILKEFGCDDVFGYYFEVPENRVIYDINNRFYSSFFREDYASNPYYRHLIGAHNLFEQYIAITNQKRTCGYCNNNSVITPLFESNIDDTLSNRKESIQNINIEVCKKYAQFYVLSQIYRGSDVILSASMAALGYFMKRPKRFYVKALNGIMVSDDALSSKYYVNIISFNILRRRNIEWWKGSFVLTYGYIGLLLFGIWQKTKNILK